MKPQKFYSLLATLIISLFVFTACEDTGTDPVDPANTPIPTKVTNLMAGCADASTIVVTWDAHNQKDSTWFKDFKLTVLKEGATEPEVFEVEKTATQFDFKKAEEGVVYTFTIAGRNQGDTLGSAATIRWATAGQYDKTMNNSNIIVYVSESDKGSGLQMYNEAGEGPKVITVANQKDWNLGLYTTNNTLKFGSASALGYSSVKDPADAEITGLFDVDTDILGSIVFGKPFDDASEYTFSKKTIDLQNDPIAVNATKGVCLIARTLDKKHYAKIVILKKDGNFLQGSDKNKGVQLYISYQHKENTPYAKR